jgi:hypothetical protein
VPFLISRGWCTHSIARRFAHTAAGEMRPDCLPGRRRKKGEGGGLQREFSVVLRAARGGWPADDCFCCRLAPN